MTSNDPVLERQLHGHKAAITCVSFNPREKSIASGDSENAVMIWHLKKSATALRLQGHRGPVNDVNFSPKQNLLASASHDRTVRLWVPTYSGRSSELRTHFSTVRSVHFSPDGEQIVTGSDDKTVKLWNLEGSKKFVSSMTKHSNWVRCTRFSPDGSFVGSCSDDKSAVLWDIRDPKKPTEVISSLESCPTFLAFQPGNNTCIALAFTSGHVRLYDLRSSQQVLQSYKAHTDQVNQVDFHPSGHLMITASNDGSIKVLDLMEGRPIYTLTAHKGSVTGAAFSPGGLLFSTVGEDRQVMVWKSNDAGCSSPGPRTPRTVTAPSPRIETTSWRNQDRTGSTQAKSKTPLSKTTTPHSSKDLEAEQALIRSLEARVKKLEFMLNVSSNDYSSENNLQSPKIGSDAVNLEGKIQYLETLALELNDEENDE